jgi:cytochrome c556
MPAALAALFTMPFPAQDEAELGKIMKQVGEASGRLRKVTEIKDGAADAALLSKLLKESQSFWVKHSKDDAVKWSEEGSAGAKALSEAATAGDKEAYAAAQKTMGAACQACHKVYRERLPDGTYKLKGV